MCDVLCAYFAILQGLFNNYTLGNKNIKLPQLVSRLKSCPASGPVLSPFLASSGQPWKGASPALQKCLRKISSRARCQRQEGTEPRLEARSV